MKWFRTGPTRVIVSDGKFWNIFSVTPESEIVRKTIGVWTLPGGAVEIEIESSNEQSYKEAGTTPYQDHLD